jgi:succinate semialdehyde reductase (NADPH)
MRAAVLRQYNQPLKLEDLHVAPPQRGEVKVRIQAAGVCHSDLYVLEGATPVPPPLVPGHEAVAVVEEVGPDVDGFSPGDVVVTSFIWPCGRCRNCIRGAENLCENFAKVRLRGVLLDGTTRLRSPTGEEIRIFLGGTWAEEAVVPATAVAKLPPSMKGRRELAMLGCAYLTAYGAVVNTGSVSPGDVVAVIGTGGVGLAAVQVAKAVGARVVAVGRNPQKLKIAAELGAEVVDTKSGDAVKAVQELTGGRGADVVIEAVGSDETIQQAVDMAALGGRVVLVGLMPVGHKTPLALARVVRGGIQILGNYGARPRLDLPVVIKMVERGLLQPERLAGPVYKLEEINEAVEALRSGRAIRPIVVP